MKEELLREELMLNNAILYTICIGTIIMISLFIWVIYSILSRKTYIYVNHYDETISRNMQNLKECKELYLEDCVRNNSFTKGKSHKSHRCFIYVVRRGKEIGFYHYSQLDSKFHYMKDEKPRLFDKHDYGYALLNSKSKIK